MSYEYTRYKLERDPLSLVLCQVRFSAVRKMPDFIPDIQDRLRRKGFPNDASVEGHSVVINQGSDGLQSETKPIRRDEFRSKDERWAVVVGPGMLALVTTDYDRFAGFKEKLQLVLEEVDSVAELNLCQLQRVGIRYVDVIEPTEDETYRDYIQKPLHGLQSNVFVDGEQVVQSQTAGRTKLGTLTVRVWQNNEGQVIPPDVMQRGKPMPAGVTVGKRNLITLVDTDHAVAGSWDYDLSSVLETVETLHLGCNSAWFNDIVTPHALRTWGATNV